MNRGILNALTVDVEDYFHVSAFAAQVKRAEWPGYESRVERNTRRLLDIFGEHDVKATFFVLGWVAERCRKLVKEIAAKGHEIACHGYSHELVYNQTAAVFREETARAKGILEDIVGTAVPGYRAASYSITNRSRWALDILAELGFVYDSSIFPIRHDRYGIPGAEVVPHRLSTPNGQELIEFPLSTVEALFVRWPAAGGGYFRLYPYAITRAALRRINREGECPFIFYLHPWEIDPQQPRIAGPWLSRFRHYNNLDKCEGRLRRLLNEFRFGTVEDVLRGLALWPDAMRQRAAGSG